MINYRWSMTEDDYKRLKTDINKEHCPSNNCYKGVAAGSILFEFGMDEDDHGTVPYINIYEAGNNTGYGKLKDGTPYDCIDCDWWEDLDFSGDFENFKQSAYKMIQETATDHIKKAMEFDVKPMWNGF